MLRQQLLPTANVAVHIGRRIIADVIRHLDVSIEKFDCAVGTIWTAIVQKNTALCPCDKRQSYVA